MSELSAPTGALSERVGWALIEQAETRLGEVDDQHEAADLYQRIATIEEAMRRAQLAGEIVVAMGRVRLRAERRWGELLGPAEHGGDRRSDQVSAAHLNEPDRQARAQARRVWEVPAEMFEAYVTAERDDPPTRAGLIRLAPKKPKPRKRGPTVAQAERERRERFHEHLKEMAHHGRVALDAMDNGAVSTAGENEVIRYLDTVEKALARAQQLRDRLMKGDFA